MSTVIKHRRPVETPLHRFKCGNVKGEVLRMDGITPEGGKWDTILSRVECTDLGGDSFIERDWADQLTDDNAAAVEDEAVNWCVSLCEAIGRWSYDNFGGQLPRLVNGKV